MSARLTKPRTESIDDDIAAVLPSATLRPPGYEQAARQQSNGATGDRESRPVGGRLTQQVTTVRSGVLTQVQLRVPHTLRKRLKQLAVQSKRDGDELLVWEQIAAVLSRCPDTGADLRALVEQQLPALESERRRSPKTESISGHLPAELLGPIDDKLDDLDLDEDFRCSMTTLFCCLLLSGPRSARELRTDVHAVRQRYPRGPLVGV